MTSDSAKSGGIVGKKLAVCVALLVGLVLALRAFRGGDTDAEDAGGAGVDTSGGVSTADTAERESVSEDVDTGSSTGNSDGDSSGSDLAENAADTLSVDTDVKGRFDDIDIVDAIYILMAGLKAAREEYRQRTDDGGA